MGNRRPRGSRRRSRTHLSLLAAVRGPIAPSADVTTHRAGEADRRQETAAWSMPGMSIPTTPDGRTSVEWVIAVNAD